MGSECWRVERGQACRFASPAPKPRSASEYRYLTAVMVNEMSLSRRVTLRGAFSMRTASGW